MKRSIALSVALWTLVACKPPGEEGSGTLGREGNVRFEYQRGCLFGCPIEQPLLSGTEHAIAVTGPGDGEDVRVESSDPATAEFALQRQCYCEKSGGGSRVEVADDAECRAEYDKTCENLIVVQAVADGNATLSLFTGSRTLLDRIGIEVRDAARARFAVTAPDDFAARNTDEVMLRVGESADVELILYDEEDRELLAPEGVAWSVEDPAVATVVAWLAGGGPMVNSGLSVTLNAVAAGGTELRVDVPGLTASLSVLVE